LVISCNTVNEKSSGLELCRQFAWQQITRECTCSLVRTNSNSSRGTENDGEDSSEGKEGSGKASAGKAGTGEEACGEEARGKEAGRQEAERGGVEPSSRLKNRDVRIARWVRPSRIKTGGGDCASGFVLSTAS
jgi:hypothetical protein